MPKLPENLILKQLAVGPMANFQYFLGDKRSNEIAVVDPAWDIDFLRSEAKRLGYKIVAIFLTHGHHDHINGLDDLLSTHDVPVYISENEHPLFMPRCKNLKKIKDRTKLKIGAIEFDCILAPGHSPGCQLFKYDHAAVCGDAIFIDGCGRCDLPGSDPKAMYHSLYNIIMKFSDSTILYPGHNYGPTPYATVAEQKATNPYLQCESLNEFLEQRMGISL
ncbi:MAG: hypothetical protein A2787_04100 [Omnitrophica WOR_2 bacterium RIFCSPHIGHO2_01_FULL_48_9]|nr:MAG: hypothetical protein A3D10_07500 [Omnitrophica WOR_2 bacterium RIFCSPHIGHO2_02_FULL_48_11]OGX34167.1 MAG: hypothetical protein A2787_04100 [Omnitrophica WOR_2 bacterium RIFCSPHIGHO2_01_FULL_48_9]